MSSRLLTEIGDLVAILDPDKVRGNSNRALDMLADRGLLDDLIIRREMAEVLLECVKQVFYDDMWMPSGERFIATNQRDGVSDEPAETFGRTLLAMLEERERRNFESVAAVQQHITPLIMEALDLNPFSYAESRILYPSAYAAHVLRGPIFCDVYPDVRRRVFGIMGEIREWHYRAVREAPSEQDKTELVSTTEFVSKWMSEKFPYGAANGSL